MRSGRRSESSGSGRHVADVLRASFALGLTSFGGPIAHLGYFERAYVERRRWVTAEQYADLVATCQMLPGPTSSQVGFLIGLHHAGWLGGLVAWIGFTLPSALLLFAAASLSASFDGPRGHALIHGLELVAVPVIADALIRMTRALCPDGTTRTLALAAAVATLIGGGGVGQALALTLGALAGAVACRGAPRTSEARGAPVPQTVAATALVSWCLLLLVLPFAGAAYPGGLLALASVFYRSGALVFGGGHVVLPLLRDSLVPAGWIGDERFLAGYGLAQAVPGPLFTVAAYLGASSTHDAPPLLGAIVATLAIFLPGLLLATGSTLLGRVVADRPSARGAFAGIDAAVVGILFAAFVDPVCATSLLHVSDVVIAAAALALLQRASAPPLAALALTLAGSFFVAAAS